MEGIIRQQAKTNIPGQLTRERTARLSPTPANPPRAVLDLRTGVGHWAIEFADRNPHSHVYGIDLVHMQEEWVPVNCQFLIDDLTKQDWHTPFHNIDIIHIGALGGDRQLLTCIMDGAYRCCAPGGVVEIWDTTIWLQESSEETGLHHFYHDMHDAYRRSGRFLDLPLLYSAEFGRHGFINVVDHVYNIPLDPKYPNPLARAIVKNWADGFESYSLELFDKELQKRCLDSLLDCATARQALRKGVKGFLQV
ncbi:hypothetical protein EYZ11_005994 [Aspergillus tanneri]|uniref:Methyltransferase domain-containing protein n=1 Tax=Aspergillus tanneri TaxID=1220188 RepID=A0A4S3JGV4_9EURO|nr:hypothetical protein EYZ11_005994 [Aspergillus tanneri]